MQFQCWYYIATNVCSRKSATTFGDLSDTAAQKGHDILFSTPCYLLAPVFLSGVPDYFGRNKISSGGDLSHYSSASLY